MIRFAKTLLFAALALPAIAFGQAAADPDGILRQPIPDKLVVLTFDDAPASHATVVAPILKDLGFGGTMYVCDFDSFRTRKDWYLTYRQMQTMAKDGFEIGNHTVGHGGGLSNFLAMEDALLAHGCPKPTTVCWPVYAAAPTIYPDLAANGYTFGRGGYERPYRPTVDNPFDVPSFTIKDSVNVEAFIKQAQQACQGRIVVYCFHGVPDMEHAGVSLEPATFKVMMQYLKDNNYRCIAMRDLAKYIDPAKAAKLAQTRGNVRVEAPFETIKDDKPYVAGPITKPKPAPVAKAVSSPAKNLSSFEVPGATSVDIAGMTIGVYVPAAADVKALAPTFKLPPLATAVPPSGTSRDFTKPQTYTVAAQDGSTRVFTVSVIKGGEPSLFTWGNPAAGNWSDAAKWAGGAAPGGKGDTVLSFDRMAKISVTNDLRGDFPICRVAFGDGGETLLLSGKSIAFTKNSVSGFPPVITVGKDRRRATFEMPVTLASDLHVQTFSGSAPNSFITFKGVVSGAGAVVLDSYGEPETARINSHDGNYGIVQFENTNTYGGGTVANGGKILVMKPDGLGTGPVTLNDFATLGAHARIGNPVVINQGRLFDSICEGPVTLNAVADFYGDCHIHGAMNGPGGFTMLGKMGTYLSIIHGGTATLHGKCNYTGPTTVLRGTLLIKRAAGLYGADTMKWTAKNITVHPTATLRLNAGGREEFTGAQIGTLLKNLTTGNENNGLLGGAWVCLDTANATEPVVIPAAFTDSTGTTGGAITFKKSGPGTVQLTGMNSYSGRTYVEGGALSIASWNSVQGRKPGSSLGAPATLEDAMIDLSGDATFIYTGNGETTDRILDLNGQKQTLTLDQSGSGPLKFTSPFDISGHGFSKTIVLQGAGAGELAAGLTDPHDRKKEAALAVTKTGAGVWTLSGTNTYSGPTTVSQGTLVLGSAGSLGARSALSVAAGAMLDLNFKGEMRVARLTLDGQAQPPGIYGAANAAKFIKGTGSLKCE
ncbi:MAG: autotransporter-associated beta strand repeat-containing protein [Chthoniobacter sp.]|nr:autotransporter-associated beta strand repeat-containing protein [Chthoniobacter sp.]